jgi:hypothetical protein
LAIVSPLRGQRTSVTGRRDYIKYDTELRNYHVRNVSGLRDGRTLAKKMEDLVTGFDEKILLEKSRAGFSLGQNYINGNYYHPVELLHRNLSTISATTMEDPTAHRYAVINPRPSQEAVRERVNHTLYETFLGEVGQLDKHPYQAIKNAGGLLLDKLIDAARHSQHELAVCISENWNQIFDKTETARIYSAHRY